MQSARLSATAVASDKVKHQKLNFYINGKISNFSRIENVQFSQVDEGSDFIYSLSENMECIIEQSQTVVSVEKELKRFQKKMSDFKAEDKINGFINCVKGTYDFIYGVSGENEIEFSKDKLFTGFLLSGGKIKALSTNFNSFYRIRKGNVDNFFEKIEKPHYSADKPKDIDYSPSKGVFKEYETDDILKGDIFLFATTNANTRIDEEIIKEFHKEEDDTDETAWHIVNEAAKHSIVDNFIVITVSIDGFSEHGFLEKVVPLTSDEMESDDNNDISTDNENEEITKDKKAGFFASAASIFKSGKKESTESIDTEEVLVENSYIKETKEFKTEKIDDSGDISTKSRLNFPGMNKEYKKLNIKRPGFMKRRMNIYFKRIISIIVVLVLMAGIVWGMYHLLKLIFTENEQIVELSPTPEAVATPTPTPTPTPEPTLEPTPVPTEEIDQVYMEYTVQSGDTLSKISATFYDGKNYVAEIVAYNEGITDPALIRVGQVIKLPILTGTDP